MGAFAQTETDSTAVVNKGITPVKEVYPQKEEDGDLYHGLTRKLTFDRMIPPYGLEVTYDKTTHIIFPSSVRYVDLGSPNLIAGKADGAENVIRVKATVKNFREETNMSVITESGSFYTFNVKYAEEPLLLNIEMKDFIHDGSEVNRPNNALDIYLKELGSESPKLVYLISKSVHKDNKRHIKHIGSKAFGIQYLLRGLYTHNGLLYFHTQIRKDVYKRQIQFDTVGMVKYPMMPIMRDIERLSDPDFIPDSSNAVYITFLIIGIIGYLSLIHICRKEHDTKPQSERTQKRKDIHRLGTCQSLPYTIRHIEKRSQTGKASCHTGHL